jgi:hypothetical protein
MSIVMRAGILCALLSACTSIPDTPVAAVEKACMTPVQATGSNLLKRKACPLGEESNDHDGARDTATEMRDEQRARNLKKIPNQG